MVISALGNVPPASPINTVTPFTYRDNDTYLIFLERLRTNLNLAIDYINDVSVNNTNEINAAITALTAELNATLATALTTINESTATLVAMEETLTTLQTDIGATETDVANALTTLNTLLTTVNADIANRYTKAEVDAFLGNKANTVDVYSKVAADLLLAAKADKNAVVYRVADYANAQACIDAAPTASIIQFPAGNTAITTALSITKSLTLRGSGSYTSRIYATGCNGINVAPGVADFHMENIEVACATRYSVTTNTLVGINVDGTTGSRPFNHVYRDVYVDGFMVGIQTRYLWGSIFDNVRTGFGLRGLHVYGLSVNNFVSNCSFAVQQMAASRGIVLHGRESSTDTTAVASEGWHIINSLIYGGEIGIEGVGYTHVSVSDCIIDFCSVYGIMINSNTVNFGGNWTVHDNYIAMSGNSGSAAISCSNAVVNSQNAGNRIHHNYVLTYSGSTCAAGIHTPGAEGFSTITGNVTRGFVIDIYLVAPNCIVTDNKCISPAATPTNIYMTGAGTHLVANNIGTVYLSGGDANVYAVSAGGKKIWSGLAAPTAGTHEWGEQVRTPRFTVGQPKGWVCTVAGTPGTWVSEGIL